MIKNKNLVFKTAGASSRDEDKFFQLPKIPTASLPAAAAANEGGLVYDATTNGVKYSDGSSWSVIGTKGDTGIQGVKGDTGSTGAAGAKGDTGVKGDTGA